jgi:RND superfamily putative drug exporter
VVIQYDTLIWDNATHSFDSKKLDATDGLAGALSNMSSVFKVTSSAYNSLSGQRIDLAKNWTAAELLLSLGATNRTVMLTVVLRDQPFSSKAVHEITDIRAECQGYKDRHPELSTAEVLIGGSTAGTADIGATVTHDFPISAALVLIGVYVILLLVLGSVLIPLRLMLTILLSISWTLALAFMIFTWWLSIPVLWILPILLFVILMGLGMDYDIFLMTRVKEEVMRGKSDEDAIAHAVEHTGGIITICGVIMAGAFGTMMLSSTGLLEEFGFGLSFAILLDAIIVRIYLVPAIMVLLKKWNWWAPFGLQKVRRETDGKGAGDSEE